ncbi:MAG: PD-(D/E)XK nuclease family transposase [Clostridiales bacterium]|nr:PD-(D/E)XK nuclease family transposase [Clostridiales bacterium]
MDFIKGSGIDISKFPDKVQAIVGLYAPLDGMNEKGFAVSVNMIQDSATIDQETGKNTNDGAIELILNVEIQRKANPGYNLKMRGSYYIARAFSEQLKDISDDANYDKLKKVYSVWIVSNSPKEEIVKYSFMNTKTRTIDPVNDPFSLIMIYLGKQRSKDKVIRYIKALFERDMKYLKKYYNINEDMERSMESMCHG